MKINNGNILIIDDETSILYSLKRVLENEGFNVTTTEKPLKSIDIIKENNIDVVLTDYSMKEINGLELLTKILTFYNDLPVIIMTAYGDENIAVNCIKNGAYHYISKPFSNEDLIIHIRNACETSILKKQYKYLENSIHSSNFNSLIGISDKIKNIRSTLKKISSTEVSVLITGESGTGKEVVAKLIHENSMNSKGPFISLNCAAIPSELLESELFGYEKGSFTGAYSTKKGKFELANNGTLFLDEIGEMSLSLQAKLLRVLPELKFHRVCGSKLIEANCRLIYATNKDLKKEIIEKNFRKDLFYRINVVNIHIPPLRERKEDIYILAEHFITKFCKKYSKNIENFDKIKNILYEYNWPGNIRELEHIIEQAIVLCNKNYFDPILFNDLTKDNESNDIKTILENIDFAEIIKKFNYKQAKSMFLSEFDKLLFGEALNICENNKNKASKMLGLHYKNFFTKLKELENNKK